MTKHKLYRASDDKCLGEATDEDVAASDRAEAINAETGGVFTNKDGVEVYTEEKTP